MKFTSSTKLYPTLPCSEIYDDKQLKDQFESFQKDSVSYSYQWYCADVPSIKVQNDARVNKAGWSSYFVVNYCKEAASYLGYTDENCESDSTKTDLKIQTWLVNTKTITRYFSPESYDGSTKSMKFQRAVAKDGLFRAGSLVPQLDFKIGQTVNQFSSSRLMELPIEQGDTVSTFDAEY